LDIVKLRENAVKLEEDVILRERNDRRISTFIYRTAYELSAMS